VPPQAEQTSHHRDYNPDGAVPALQFSISRGPLCHINAETHLGSCPLIGQTRERTHPPGGELVENLLAVGHQSITGGPQASIRRPCILPDQLNAVRFSRTGCRRHPSRTTKSRGLRGLYPSNGAFSRREGRGLRQGQKRCQERWQDAFSSHRENIRCYRFVAHLGRSLSSAFRACLFGWKIDARDRT